MVRHYKIAFAVGTFLVVSGLILLFSGQLKKLFFEPTGSSITAGANLADTSKDVSVIAENLTVPWGIAFLPDGDLLVTERSGTLRRIGGNHRAHAIAGVEHVGEGGLLGVAIDPKYTDNSRIYLYMTTRTGDTLTNRIERYIYKNDRLTDRAVLLQNIPGERNHDGGRLAFGPDGYLYVTTGDAGIEQNAQDKSSLAGKILRLTTEGAPAPGNPFGNAVYSYGHRNPQGLAWDNNAQLWSTEHGRSGVGSGYDELNRISPGANYGWPAVQGDETQTGMEPPIAHSGPDETWAPAGLTYAEGSLFFGGLRGQSLYEVKLSGSRAPQLVAHFRGDYGRLRTTAAKDGFLYMTTSNTDGRGNPKVGDDKLIRLRLETLFK